MRELTDTQHKILKALRDENDKGPYRDPRYVAVHDVSFASGFSVSTCSRHLRAFADARLVIATADSGRKGGWKIDQAGRGLLRELEDG